MGSRLIRTIYKADVTAPPTPDGLTVTVVDESRISLACDTVEDSAGNLFEASGTVSYKWWQAASEDGTYTLIATTTVPAYSVTGLAEGTEYWFKVSATDGTNESAKSDPESGTTFDIGDPPSNEPPVWGSPAGGWSITIYSTTLPGATVFTLSATDPDGDALTYAAVTALPEWLSISGAVVTLAASVTGGETWAGTFSVTDGIYTVTSPSLTVNVVSAETADADFLARATGPGVFYATNCQALVRGCDGYTAVGGQVGRYYNANEYTSTIDLVPDARQRVDFGDGKGLCWRETDADIVAPLSGAARASRRGYQISNYGVRYDLDWLIAPWKYMPDGYEDGYDSVPAAPGYRYNLSNEARKYVETESNPLLTSTSNPGKLPVARHFYLQFSVKLNRELLWGRPRYWITARDRAIYGMNGADPNPYHVNKLVFVTGGLSDDQVAVNTRQKTGVLNLLLYDLSTNSLSLTRAHAGVDTVFAHPNIDLGSPPTSSATAGEVMLQRYGPSAGIMSGGNGMTGLGALPAGITDRFQYMTGAEATAAGVSISDANMMSASWRGYPFGGFDAETNRAYPDLALSDDVWAGVLEPDKWTTVEVLVSDQVDAYNNDDTLIRATKSPVYPRFVAMWAATHGEAPKLLGYTNQGDSAGPAMVASQINDSNAPIFKWQDANLESYREMGAYILGPSDHAQCMTPTALQFDVVRTNRARLTVANGGLATTLRYRYGTSSGGGAFNCGTRPDWAGGSTLGFSSGTLSGTSYLPSVDPAYYPTHQQYEVESSEPVTDGGAQVYVAPPGSTTLAPVHRITLREATPVAPSAGDCVIFNVSNDRNIGMGYLYYGEVLFSVDPIPFPGHLSTQLPMPWKD